MNRGKDIKGGSEDQSTYIRIIDSTDGTPETNVTAGTTGLSLQYSRLGEANVTMTAGNLSGLTDAHTDKGIFHAGSGYYRVDLPDAACGATATGVLVHGSVTGMIVIGSYHQLVAYDPHDAVRLGLSALPNAAAAASGGLFTRGTGAGQINQDANGRIDVNVAAISTDSGAADNCESYFDGTGYKNVNNFYNVRSATAQTASGSTIVLDASASGSDDFYNNQYIHIISGTGANQSRFITDYTGGSFTADVSPNWVTNPASDSVFIIWPFGSLPGASAPSAADVADAVWDEARSGHVGSGTFGEYVNADTLLVNTSSTAAGTLSTIYQSLPATIASFGLTDAGAAQAATSTSITLRSTFSAPDSGMIGQTVHVYSSTNGLKQTRAITAWNNSTKVATVDAWDQTPTGTILYAVYATAPASSTNPAPVNVTRWSGTAVATPDTAGYPKVTIKSGTGTGEISLSSGVASANITQIASTTGGVANLAAMYDGTGYAGGTAKLTVDITKINGTTGGVANLLTAFSGGSYNVGGGAVVAASVTGNVGGDVQGNLDGNVGGNVAGNVTGTIGDLASSATGTVNAQMVDVLFTDTYTEPGQGAPGVNVSLSAKIGYLYKVWRNRKTNDGTETIVYADDASTPDHKSTASTSSGTLITGEWTSGA